MDKTMDKARAKLEYCIQENRGQREIPWDDFAYLDG
jgi:hypothetical protein